MAETRKTLCNRDCPDACSIVATVENGEVTRVQGDKDHPITRGFLCSRTTSFLKTMGERARITSPLMRRGSELVPVDWETALDFVADKLLQIRWLFILAVCAASGVGIAMLYSAAGGNMEPWAIRQLVRFIVALGILVAVAVSDM